MPLWNVGDRVRVVERKVTEEDRKKNRYYEHMAGLVGTIQNVYDEEVAIVVELDALSAVSKDVHRVATERMRALAHSEELKKTLTKEELEFVPHYVVLAQATDIEKA